jgi:hypothetical protein
MRRFPAVLTGVLVLGAALTTGAHFTFPALSAAKSINANVFSAGTVYLSDNDSGSATVSLSNARPANTSSGCIAVTYNGTLDATVRLYATVAGTLAPYVQIRVERGTLSGSFPSCTGFVLDTTNYNGLGAGVLYNGLLSAFPTTIGAAVVDPAPTWKNPDTRGYRLTATLNNNDLAQGLTSNVTFIWQGTNK